MPPPQKKGLQKLSDSGNVQAVKDAEISRFKDKVNVPNASPSGSLPYLSLENQQLLPVFIRGQTMYLGNSPPGDIQPNNVAHTRGNAISVDNGNLFSPDVLSHEGTHVFQHSRQVPPVGNNNINLYGGDVSGLSKLRNSGGTINDLDTEQQAQMVENANNLNGAIESVYNKQGVLTPEQSKYFEDQKSVYAPFLNQLAGQPTYDPNRPVSYNSKGEQEVGYLPNKWYGAPPDASDFSPPVIPTPPTPPGYISGITNPNDEIGGLPMRTNRQGLDKLK